MLGQEDAFDKQMKTIVDTVLKLSTAKDQSHCNKYIKERLKSFKF